MTRHVELVLSRTKTLLLVSAEHSPLIERQMIKRFLSEWKLLAAALRYLRLIESFP